MNELLYKIRRSINRFKRRYLRPTAEGFSDKMEFEPKFKKRLIIFICIFLVIVAIVLLTVFDVINIDFIGGKDSETQPPIETIVKPTEIVETPLITPVPTDTPAPTPVPTPVITPIVEPDALAPLPLLPNDVVIETGYIDIDFLNVRAGSTLDHDVLGVLPRYSKVEVLAKEDWLKIKFLDGYGYISSKYYIQGTAPTPTPAPSEIPQGYDGPIIRRRVQEDMVYEKGTTKIVIDKVREDDHTFYAVEIWCTPSEIQSFLVDEELDSSKRMVVSDMAKEVGAIFAVNGDFVSYRDDGVAIRNGELFRDKPAQEMMILRKDGTLEGVYVGDMDGEDMIEEEVWQCWSFGPILVEDSVAFDDFSYRSNVKPENPRTGIGMLEPGHYLIIVADGRQELIDGFTMVDFAKLFEDYGCVSAYNLDGGEATTLYFEGEIINSPSGVNQKASGDIIYIK